MIHQGEIVHHGDTEDTERRRYRENKDNYR